MRRVRYHTHGGPEVLAVEDGGHPRARPRAGVLLRTEAIGVNYVDVQLRRETVTGLDLVSPAARHFDRGRHRHGSRRPARLPIPPWPGPAWPSCSKTPARITSWPAPTGWLTAPGGLDAGAASMLPTAGAVALGALRSGGLADGETVLVTSGAGGIGHLAIQLAQLQGAGTVIATAGSPARSSASSRSLGADVAINHTQPGWAGRGAGGRARRA